MIPARTRIHNLVKFTGWSTVGSIGLLWLFGIVHLLLELGLATLLQQFLAAMGLITVHHMAGPWVLHNLSLTGIILLIFLVSSARAMISLAQGVIGGGAMERFTVRLRNLLIEDCLNASTVKTAETLTFFNQRIYTASVAIQSVQALTLQSVLALGLLTSLFLLSPLPTLMLLCVLAVVAIPVRLLNRRLKKSATLHADALSKIMLHLNNVFRNFLLIRLFNLQESERKRIQGHLKNYSRYISQYYWTDGLSGAVVPLVVILSVLWVAVVQDRTSAIEKGLAVAYLYLAFRFAQTLVPLLTNISRLSFASHEFLYTYNWWLQHEPDNRSIPQADVQQSELLPVVSPMGWALKGVSFGYPEQTSLFDRLDLQITPGSILRVRGTSGVGKSTLVRLLVGEEVPTQGKIEVQLDDELFPVANAAARLRNHIGYSSSEPYLFEGTIFENITYGVNLAPDDEFLLECASLAECQFILELPQKFDHWIDELGQGLSTGQKQRLSLLRALLRRPKALILDEALSNVDIPTENRIMAKLTQLKDGCTMIWISHREHLNSPADSVLHLEGRS